MDQIIDAIMDAYEGEDPWAFEDEAINQINSGE